jgi:hypothetical protein
MVTANKGGKAARTEQVRRPASAFKEFLPAADGLKIIGTYPYY